MLLSAAPAPEALLPGGPSRFAYLLPCRSLSADQAAVPPLGFHSIRASLSAPQGCGHLKPARTSSLRAPQACAHHITDFVVQAPQASKYYIKPVVHMAHINLSVDDQAHRACTRSVVQPHQINPLAAYYHHIPQIFQPLQGDPEIGEDEAEHLPVLNCVTDGLDTFRECEYYRITRDSEELEDAPEDDSDGEELMEDKEEHPVEGSEAEANAVADHINPDE